MSTLTSQGLRFYGITPQTHKGLGGSGRDRFRNGRLTATVGWGEGLGESGFWDDQHPEGAKLFETGLEAAWFKLSRTCIGSKNDSLLVPDVELATSNRLRNI